MSNTTQRLVTLAICMGLLTLQVSPAFAQFTGTGQAAGNWFVQLAGPIIPFVVAGVGIGCLIGRISWMWFGGAVLGTALFFGRDQVVSLFRSFVGA